MCLAGAVPTSILTDKSKHPNEFLLEQAIRHHSFLARNGTEKQHIIQNYYKFIMYRNPVERLVSAYMSKIRAYPMIGLKDSQPERNWLRLNMYQFVYPGKFMAWVKRGSDVPITIDFPDFIKYWIATEGIRTDEHFKTIFELCSPCQIRYSYYGNFNMFEREVGVFSKRIQGNSSHLMNAEHQNVGPTSSIAPTYYRQLTYEQKTKIVDLLATELYFYYALFPTEIGSYKDIMGVDYEIPEME